MTNPKVAWLVAVGREHMAAYDLTHPSGETVSAVLAVAGELYRSEASEAILQLTEAPPE